MYIIPSNKQFSQTNRSNVLGNLWATKNIDLDSNKGVMRVGQKLQTTTTAADDAQLGVPWAFEFFDGRWWAICGGSVFKNSSEELTVSFTEDASTNAITTYDYESDLAVFDGQLWATAPGKLMSKVTGSGTGNWTDSTGSANLTGSINKLAYLRKFNRLYFIEANDEIASIDDGGTMSLTGDYNLDLHPSSDKDGICALAAGSDRIWFGLEVADNTASSSGGHTGSICEWDGISAQITKEYQLQAAAVRALEIDPETDIPYAVDSEGRVLKFTGYGFQEIARFPVDKKHLTGATSTADYDDFIHHNGMAFTKNRTIEFLIKGTNEDSGATINENFPSGIWELDLETNSLTHKHSFTLKARSGATSTITDFGANRVVQVGALMMNTFANDSTSGSPTLICGAKYYTDATNSTFAIFIDSPDNPNTDVEGQKAGYFITPWLECSDESIRDTWEKAYVYYRPLLSSADKIVVKYRLKETTPVEISITWVNTTSFTTTTDVSGYVGYEVEGIHGTGAGGCAHITTVTEDGGTYTVTVDQAFTGVTTGTAKVRLQNWTKWGEISEQVEGVSELPNTRVSSPRIQLKVYMLFTGDGEFHRLKLINKPDQPV